MTLFEKAFLSQTYSSCGSNNISSCLVVSMTRPILVLFCGSLSVVYMYDTFPVPLNCLLSVHAGSIVRSVGMCQTIVW